MKLFTVQGARHWRQAKVQGVLTGGPHCYHVVPAWRRPYEWMREQMRRRLEWTTGDFPIWAWPWEQLDAFSESGGWGSPGDRMVLLGIDVPDSRAILSHFIGWHQVLNDDALLEAEDATFTEEEKVASWERIFTPEALPVDWWGDRTLQACVDRVYPSEVFLEREFIVLAHQADAAEDSK